MPTLAYATRGQSAIIDVHGVAQINCPVIVLYPDGLSVARLYTDRTRGTPAANPTNLDASGQFTFYSDQLGVFILRVTTLAGEVVDCFCEVEPDPLDLSYVSDLATKVSNTDPRLSDARPPSGGAGGDLVGSYPNPTLVEIVTPVSAGDTSHVPQVTVDGKGRVTDLASTAIVIPESAVTDLAADLAARPTASDVAADIATADADTLNAAKAYADAVASGLSPRSAATVATATNTALSGLATIDGHALLDGERVLLLGQATGSQNGLWLAHAGAWTRPADFATGSDAKSAYVFVQSGAVLGGSSWTVAASSPVVVDTTSQTWTLFFSAAAYAAGHGVSITGQVISVSGLTEADIAGLTADIAAKANVTDLATEATTRATADTTLATADATHAAAVDPHPGYATDADMANEAANRIAGDAAKAARQLHAVSAILPIISATAALNPTSPDTSSHVAGDGLRSHVGLRLCSLKVAAAAVLPTAPADPTVYSLSNFNFTTGPAAALDDLLKACHDSLDAPQIKLMVQCAADYPAWMFTGAAGAKLLRQFTKVQVTAGATTAVVFPTMLYWDVNGRYWHDYVLHGWSDWMDQPCPYNTGSNTLPHKRRAHFYAVQSSAVGLDHNTEMAEEYENDPATFASVTIPTDGSWTGAALTAMMSSGVTLDTGVATNWQFAVPIPYSTMSGQPEGVVKLKRGAIVEDCYYTSVTDDGAGHAVLHFDNGTVSHGSPHGLYNGRGWSGGTNATGAASGPARVWDPAVTTGGSITVTVFASTDRGTLGTPGAGRVTWTLENDPTRSDAAVFTGIFPAGHLNQNSYARVGLQQATVQLPGYVRNAIGIPEKTSTMTPDTEVNRVKLYARAWMDSVDTIAKWFPDLPVVQYMGQAYGETGAAFAGATNPTLAVPLVAGHDYQHDPTTGMESANDAVTDYLSLPLGNAPHAGQVFIGHTDVDTGTNWTSPTFWKRLNVTTWTNRGLPLAMQVKGGLAASDDFVAAVEFAWTTFGPLDLFAIEAQMSRLDTVIANGAGSGQITAPAVSGIPSMAVPAFAGTTTPANPAGSVTNADYVTGYETVFSVSSVSPGLTGKPARVGQFGYVSAGVSVGYYQLIALPASTAGNWQLVTDVGLVRRPSPDPNLAANAIGQRLRALDARTATAAAAQTVGAAQLKDQSVTEEKLAFVTLVLPSGTRFEYRESVPPDGRWGPWGRGDVIIYTAPIPGGYKGATCVTAGTPGTWEEWGLPTVVPPTSLFSKLYTPGTAYTTPTTPFADIDAANLHFPFTAPASGTVIVSASATVQAFSGGNPVYFNLRNGGVDLANTDEHMTGSTNKLRIVYRMKVGGLTPGTAYDWTLGWKNSGTAATIDTQRIVLEVTSAAV